jgi:hypothetical protein
MGSSRAARRAGKQPKTMPTAAENRKAIAMMPPSTIDARRISCHSHLLRLKRYSMTNAMAIISTQTAG